MSVEIEYVDWAPFDKWEQQLEDMASVVIEELKESGGFLKLMERKSDHTFYYNYKIHGIIGDLGHICSLGRKAGQGKDVKKIVLDYSGQDYLRIAHLPAQMMKKIEYEKIFQGEVYKEQWEQRGWLNIRNINIAVEGPDFLFESESHKGPVFVIPVYRFENRKPGIPVYTKDIVIRLILLGMLPVACQETGGRNWKEMSCYVERTYGSLLKGKKKGIIYGERADKKKLEEIKEYYRMKDFYATGLPVYDDTVLQEARGSWDLYSFVEPEWEKCDENVIRYDVKGKGLYARNPKEDVVFGTEQAAIDFGTKSTTVAVLDNSGAVAMIPVGSMKNMGAADFENPTIMEFKDIRRFMEDYQKSEFRPDTKFDHISVSHQAQADYGRPAGQTGIQMRQYMNHLKQWVNNPDSMPDVTDSKGEKIKLEYDGFAQSEPALNPIEIYAYYIGRNINNMHHQKIYLKYLLSYTATYAEQKREWIRASFEKGLRKSLPPQIGTDEELMKEFEVRLGCDEATAYAVSALRRYMEEDYRRYGRDSVYISQLEDGGIFYGVYDFGGGTLDFSFGVMEQEGEQDIFRQLKYGGSSNLGCENILEELAFEFFCREENRNVLCENNIKCEKPFLFGTLQNGYQIVGYSDAARFNTRSMIDWLREFWMNGKRIRSVIRLQGENGAEYLVKIKNGASDENKSAGIELQLSDKEIEYFFDRKVCKGIRLFIQYYKDVIKDDKWLADHLCFLFLAGNASRADRVVRCFYREFKEEKLTGRFALKQPLPTESDRKKYLANSIRSIPTAKSGVVFGLLRSRPEETDIKIIDETPKVSFQFHLGVKKRDRMYMDRGMFCLLLSAEKIPSSEKSYCFLMKIPQKEFTILYTSDGRYALPSDNLLIGDEVNIMTIRVSEECVGNYLYVRAKTGSAEVLELGVSDVEQKYAEEAKVIGTCDFAKGRFKGAE